MGQSEVDPEYPHSLQTLANAREYFGRMNGPDCCAFMKGSCGDAMEFYGVVEDGVLTDVRFFTEGCTGTILCGSTTSRLVIGKRITEALGVSAKNVVDELPGLPERDIHCAVLAVSTFYQAIVDYLLRP